MARKKRQSKNSKTRNLIAKTNPKSPVSEQFRTVRTNLQFASVDEALTTILLTSSGPEEGKSSTTANLAVVYAQQGKRVLLVDADMRKPSVHYTFRLDNLSGLSTYLVGESPLTNAISETDMENLDVISCGPIPPNPSELLGSQKMEQFMQEAGMAYDVILVDSPPVLAVADAQVLANLCEGSLLVVRSKQSEYDGARKAIEVLQSSQSKFLGTVLNDREKKEANYYYYYGTN